MPHFRRDQWRLAVFLLVMMTCECVLIYVVMEGEHAAARQAVVSRYAKHKPVPASITASQTTPGSLLKQVHSSRCGNVGGCARHHGWGIGLSPDRPDKKHHNTSCGHTACNNGCWKCTRSLWMIECVAYYQIIPLQRNCSLKRPQLSEVGTSVEVKHDLEYLDVML